MQYMFVQIVVILSRLNGIPTIIDREFGLNILWEIEHIYAYIYVYIYNVMTMCTYDAKVKFNFRIINKYFAILMPLGMYILINHMI